MGQNLFVIPHRHLSPYPFYDGTCCGLWLNNVPLPQLWLPFGGHFLTLKYSHSVFSVVWLENRSFVSHLCVDLDLCALSLSSRCYTMPPSAPHEFLICRYLSWLPVSSTPTITTTYPSSSLVFKYQTHFALEKIHCRWLNRIPFTFPLQCWHSPRSKLKELRPRFQAYMNPNGRCFSFDQALVAESHN